MAVNWILIYTILAATWNKLQLKSLLGYQCRVEETPQSILILSANNKAICFPESLINSLLYQLRIRKMP